LRDLESESRKRQQTQICIETPYRNQQLFATALQVCDPATRLTLATDLTLPGESVVTRTIRQWKQQTPPAIERRPTVFLLQA
jgi:16S rRNA (cytidine1402-2'-O)-methyltransferase